MLPGFCGIFGGKNCRCCRRAFWLDNPNQQCSQLHFARIYPRTSLLPELFTIWAERIGEDDAIIEGKQGQDDSEDVEKEMADKAAAENGDEESIEEVVEKSED